MYGADYLATVPFLVGVAAYRIVQTQREPLGSAVKGMGRPDAVFRISSITVAVKFAIGVALVLTIGAIGVIIATVVAETLRCLLLHRTLRRNDAAVPVLPDPLRKQFRSGGGMVAAIVVFNHALPNAFAYRVALIGSVSVMTYLALFLA